MTSIDDVEANFQQIKNFLAQIKKHSGVQIAFFPENSLYMRLKEGEKIQAIDLQGTVLERLKSLAGENQIALHLGSLPVQDQGKLSNGTVFIDSTGKLSITYKKIHLFDIDLDGDKRIRESDVFRHGEKPAVLDHANWKMGQSICYDLRFSELYSTYAKQGVEAILVPSAFLVKTGMAHWHILLRARAIESQCYVIAAAQAGLHKNSQGHSRQTYGHSLIVGPWGEIIKEGSADAQDLLIAELDRAEIGKVRRQIPMQGHRRI
jgi:predicted amidohydrolase